MVIDVKHSTDVKRMLKAATALFTMTGINADTMEELANMYNKLTKISKASGQPTMTDKTAYEKLRESKLSETDVELPKKYRKLMVDAYKKYEYETASKYRENELSLLQITY